MLRRQVMEGT